MPASLRRKFNIHESGRGDSTLLFVHGLGCNQGMWRFVAPHFEQRHRVVLMDLAGCGKSDWSAWDVLRYSTLDGHAADVAEVADTLCLGPTVLVTHSVASMIGLLADLQSPAAFRAHAMFAPSPCYLNDGSYQGGFDAATIESLLDLIERDAPTFARNLSPVIMGAAQAPEYARELESAFCASHPLAFAQFARATFLGDYRDQLPQLTKPALLLQCADDAIAPEAVGRFMAARMRDATLQSIPTRGHVPQIAHPRECIVALERFLRGLDLAAEEPELLAA